MINKKTWFPNKEEIENYKPKEHLFLILLINIAKIEALFIVFHALGMIPVLIRVIGYILYGKSILNIIPFNLLIVIQGPLYYLLVLPFFVYSLLMLLTLLVAKYLFKKSLGIAESKLLKINCIYTIYFVLIESVWFATDYFEKAGILQL